MMTNPYDDDAKLTRQQLGPALTKAGYPIAPPTLASLVTRGGGPPYCLFGGRALYRWGEAIAWARGRMTAPRRSSSEAGAQHNVSAA